MYFPRTVVLSLFAILAGGQCTSAQSPATSAERSFEFRYGAKIVGLKPGVRCKAWFPIASSSDFQTIESRSTESNGKLTEAVEEKYGNRIGFVELVVQQEDPTFGVTYQVLRKMAKSSGAGQGIKNSQRKLFLSANALVPIDGTPAGLAKGLSLPADTDLAASRLYEFVHGHMTYDKSKVGYGKGDAVWACNSKTGNCTDFHSLFISMARSQSIPAKFEIGFPLPKDKRSGSIAGYHCWAWFYSARRGWTPVDISEADKHPEMKEFYEGRLTADRIAMSVGRDIELVPAAKSKPLNYFVYPYVEVDGVPLDREQIELDVSFQDCD